MATEFKLTYFDLRARAEPIRYLFALAGKKYEDKRISMEDWPEIKQTLPMGQIPMLEHDGRTLYQATAIASYLARHFGLAGKDAYEGAVCDMIHSAMNNDVITAAQKVRFSTEDGKAAAVENLERTVTGFSKLITEYQKGKFILGDNINLADLAVTHITDLLDFVQPGLTDNHPNLTALRKAVKENPKIAQWIQDRPENTM